MKRFFSATWRQVWPPARRRARQIAELSPPPLEDEYCLGPIDLEGNLRLQAEWPSDGRSCCRNCHFLSLEAPPEPRRSFTATERARLEISHGRGRGPAEHYLIGCERGCWGPEWLAPQIDPTLKPLHKRLVEDRGDKCFFIEFRNAMTFEAAFDLCMIRRQERRDKKDRRHRTISIVLNALFIVLGGAVVAVGLRVIGWS